MKEKLKTASWFAQRLSHWAHGAAVAKRKFLLNFHTDEHNTKARVWAAGHVVPLAEALAAVEIVSTASVLKPALAAVGEELARASMVHMGGPEVINLLDSAINLFLQRSYAIEKAPFAVT